MNFFRTTDTTDTTIWKPGVVELKWFPYRCICRICRVCRTKKIHSTDSTLWKPPVQMLNAKETTDTTCCTRLNEFYLSYEFFSYDGHDRCDRYNDMETRLKKTGNGHTT